MKPIPFALLAALLAAPAAAVKAPSTIASAGDVIQAAPPLFPAASVVSPDSSLTPADWIKIGGTFGRGKLWQFGVDKSITAGACAAYAWRAHSALIGPCRDVLILARKSSPVLHIGFAVLDSKSKPNYTARIGFNVGPLAAASLNYVRSNIPYLESASGLTAPAWLSYVSSIATLDEMVGRINGRLDQGPELKLNIPLSDLAALVPGFK